MWRHRSRDHKTHSEWFPVGGYSNQPSISHRFWDELQAEKRDFTYPKFTPNLIKLAFEFLDDVRTPNRD